MEKKTTVKTENDYLVPVVLLPFQTVLPSCIDIVTASDFRNVSAFIMADMTHKKVFLPFLDILEKSESEETAQEEVNSYLMKKQVSVAGVFCEIRNLEMRDRMMNCDATLYGISFGICKKFEVDAVSGNVILGTVEPIPDDQEFESAEKRGSLKRAIRSVVKKYSKVSGSAERRRTELIELQSIKDTNAFCYHTAAYMDAEYEDRKAIICERDAYKKMLLTYELAKKLLAYEEIEYDIIQKTGVSLSEQQRENFLREQIRVIEQELGDDEAGESDILEEKLEEIEAYMAPASAEKIRKEINRMRRMPSASPDYSVMRLHVDFLLDLPWAPEKRPDIDLEEVRRVLDRDHYGLTKVKDRIVEFMAVKTMKKATASSIICLVGPPGTGKTSVVRSIAEALGREYVRISLGGVRDEAEIRGHRKTYIGAMPGRILTALEKAKSNTPVVLLDEIDKLCGDFRGDPASALLEVLDREQNKEFTDSYAEVPFDLSKVLFITTANTLDTIPSPLLDRLEVIELSSYTENEKMEIATRHLIPKQAKEHGLSRSAVKFSESAVRTLINDYTSEAGVRQLERQIAAILRKSICIMKTKGKRSVTVNPALIFEMLGAGRAIHRFETGTDKLAVGSVNGMAWTAVGGVLLNVEVNVFDGTGKLEVTGLIGDVMKESATAALSFIRSKAAAYGISPDFYKTRDIHVHVPEGATPKDGPSAGVTIATAMVSAITGIPVRQHIAMTGEITIRGDVLAIGGLKEKSLAALKEGISEILVPEENKADIRELPDEVKQGVKITTVKNVEEVFEIALAKSPVRGNGGADALAMPGFGEK
ncbi:MAG: endopeptidase La [Clostridia bacterium]|nr:endopeptidase La [Clostridia bacterium]